MIGEMIQEYLVGLGAKIDKPGFSQAEATIKSLDRTVESSTGRMAANFARASAMIGTAIAGVSASVFGLMKSAAAQDLAMQKLSRQMMVSKDAAWTMKKATDALGESIQDIMLTPELMERFNKLAADGRKMKVGGDFAETMRGFRDLMFEFTRLKQEVSYAMTWVGYYLMKYLNRPLAEAREKFRSFNDMFVKNMSTWTEKAARMLVYIINVGKHFLMLVLDVGKALWAMWESFPKGVKIAAAAIAGLTLIMRANPLTRMLLLVGSLLLLIDDYYGHMEGKQSAFGTYWDKLNEYIKTAKKYWEEFSGAVSDFADRVQSSSALNDFLYVIKEIGGALWELATIYVDAWINQAQMLYESMEKHGAVDGLREAMQKLWEIFMSVLGTVRDLIRWMGRLVNEVRRTKEYQDLIDAVGELADVLLETFNVILDLVNIAFRGLFGELGKTNSVYSFRDAIRAVFSIFTLILRVVSGTVGVFRELLTMMRDSSPFKRFWEELGRMIDGAIARVGKFGRALLAIKNGDFKGAWKIISGSDTHSGLGGDFGGSKKAVDAAMLAISGQESGGNYDSVNSDSGALGAFQIMPENWPSWAENAGLGADAPMTQENQNIVARHKFMEYYKQFGNWRDVAIAWYGGPGAVDYSEAAKNAPQYYNGNVYPSINEYADSVMGRMNKIIDDWGGLEEDTPAGGQTSAPGNGSALFALKKPHRHAGQVIQTSAYSVDPLLYNGLMSGAMQTGYGGYQTQGSGGVVYQVNVGGVTVNGTNQSAAEIGRSVGREVMSSLERSGAHILRSRAMTGAPVMI